MSASGPRLDEPQASLLRHNALPAKSVSEKNCTNLLEQH
jgi:hypothetical protein